MVYKEFHEAIKRHNIVIIHRHSDPDGDAIGSQLGLREVIKHNFPNKKVFVVGDENERFNVFGTMDNVADEAYKKALVIVLDSGDEKLISDTRYNTGKTLVKIDHHLSTADYGDINIVDTTEISTASLIGKIAYKLAYKLNTEAAKFLFLGIVADSNRFLYRGVTSATFELASKLTKFPFSMEEVYDNLYSKDLDFVKLRAQLTLDFKLTKNNVAYLMTSKETREKYGVDFLALSRGMVSVMSGIKGIHVWLNCSEDDSGVIVAEIRSNKYNIHPYALKYGGGGHPFASGATLKSFDEAQQLLEDLDKLVEKVND